MPRGLTYSQIVRKAVQAFTQPKIDFTSGGNYQWFPQNDATRAANTATFESQRGGGGGTRTGSLLTATGD